MRFETSRLRRGEVIAGVGAIALLICVFLLPWYGLSGALEQFAARHGIPTTVDGWNGLTHVRWLVLVTIVVALALFWLQATRPGPALPASLSVLATVLGIVTSLALIDRVLISVPAPTVEWGAYLALLSSLVLTYGAFRSLREEGRPDPERNAAIPTVKLQPRG